MRAVDVMMDAIQYIEFMYPLDCTASEIRHYLNALKRGNYSYDEVKRFMNYYCQNAFPIFEREKRCNRVHYKLR